MKKTKKLHHWLTTALLGTTLLASTSASLAADDWLKTFDASGSTANWVTWWGTATISWDGTQNSTPDNPSSGSMKYVSAFVGNSGEQFMTFDGFGDRWQWDGVTYDGTKYTNFSFDIKIDPSTAVAANGANYGTLQLGFTRNGWPSDGAPTLGYYTIPLTATGWTHVVMPIDPTLNYLDIINGVYIKMWSNGTLTNTWTAYFDNLLVKATPTNDTPPPPPSMAIEKATPGLQLISTSAGGGNARYNLRPASPGYSFVDSPATTYEVTIKKYPSKPNVQTHIFLAPAGSIPWGPGDTSVDWNATNLIFLQIANNADGSAYSRFMYKTNVAGGGWGGQIFGANTLAELGSASIVGKWTLKFQNTTNVTFTSPDGSSTNFVFPAASAEFFRDSTGLYPYIGLQPNNDANVGVASVVGGIKITGGVDGIGTPSPDINDTFATAPLNTTTWAVVAGDPNGIRVVDATTPYWLLWTVPDSGYGVQYSATIANAAWTDDTQGLRANAFQVGAQRRTLVPASMTAGNSLYFRLLKRTATKLQVLLDGEANAPGTPTGKIGSPTPVSIGAGGQTVVTVHAVDDTFHIVPGLSTAVTFSTTDPTGVFSPLNTALSNGTAQTTVMFQSEGNWTITATDVSATPTLTAGTSSSVSVTP